MPHHLSSLLILCFLIAASAHARQFIVGGDDGWRVPDDSGPDLYAAWAAQLRFRVSDSVLFQYKNDSVVRVDKIGYYHCNQTSAADPRDGTAVFLLDAPGFFYFVSADADHCTKGQRLAVDVMTSRAQPRLLNADAPAPASSAARPAAALLCASIFSTLFQWAAA